MPEGDTIFRAARTLDRALRGTAVTRFESVLPALTRVDDDRPIAGRTIESVRAAGKHLLVAFSGGLTLRTHMRMNGSWHIYRPGEPWRLPRSAMRLAIETASFVAVAFKVPVAEFLDDRAAARREDLAAMGPDLLAEGFDAGEVIRRIRARPDAEIAQALLNQRIVAGAGNIYKSETLFVAGVNPFTRVSRVSDEDLARILATARRLMQLNVREGAPGGIVTVPGLRRTTGRADPSERLWVYGRSGRPCRRCGTAIERRKQGPDARSTYWCPGCQPRA
jgi:endonuclease-8